jgi:hypothetical protein
MKEIAACNMISFDAHAIWSRTREEQEHREYEKSSEHSNTKKAYEAMKARCTDEMKYFFSFDVCCRL